MTCPGIGFTSGCMILLLCLALACVHYRAADDRDALLARNYCGACHAFPSPALLDKQTWKTSVLPVMANFMNLRYVGDSLKIISSLLRAPDSAALPDVVTISPEDFRRIEAFYLSAAPDSLPVQNGPGIPPGSDLFQIVLPVGNEHAPFSTAVAIDTLRHQIYQADAVKRSINVFDERLQQIDQVATNNICTALQVKNDSLYITNIGEFKPNPGKLTGNIMISPLAHKRKGSSLPRQLLDKLDRSVTSVTADLDNDGKPDELVCEFGFLKGNFCWYRNDGRGGYEKRLIKPVPGAIKVYVEDVNHDGRPDIWALFGQAREGISLFVNKGNGRFEEKEILTFPPVYGSSYFELADMDHDGKEDIIYTCGDNADYSRVLKNFHGVYIFLNQGNNIFKQAYFFPIHGCYKAIARDFDRDGDPDLACISYFADYDHRPEESFVYLENMGNLHFSPHTITNLPKGRWVSMDAGDADGDGRIDIVLGNLATPYQDRKDWQAGWMQAPALLLLHNNIK